MTSLMDVTEGEFASALGVMTEDELFSMMKDLEVLSEKRRFPGQLLLPYKEWRRRVVIG